MITNAKLHIFLQMATNYTKKCYAKFLLFGLVLLLIVEEVPRVMMDWGYSYLAVRKKKSSVIN